ncbi:ATP-binding cassette domain-containing protein, partial [Acinetobacter sp. 163]|nr:ATP-binding cassette domain-containing protein [Acinetobacter sp. 163]
RIIDELNLHDLALRYVDELSGGEYQKVIIGRALVQETDVLLLDEPTNNLDMANQSEVMSLIRATVDDRGIAAAAVMHDLNLSLRYCDRFLMVKNG